MPVMVWGLAGFVLSGFRSGGVVCERVGFCGLCACLVWLLSLVDDGEHVEEGFHGVYVVFVDHGLSALWAGHAQVLAGLVGGDGVCFVSAVVACGGDGGDVGCPCGLGSALGAGDGLSWCGGFLELFGLLAGWLVAADGACWGDDGGVDGVVVHGGSPWFLVLVVCGCGVCMIPWLALAVGMMPVLHMYALLGMVMFSCLWGSCGLVSGVGLWF